MQGKTGKKRRLSSSDNNPCGFAEKCAIGVNHCGPGSRLQNKNLAAMDLSDLPSTQVKSSNLAVCFLQHQLAATLKCLQLPH